MTENRNDRLSDEARRRHSLSVDEDAREIEEERQRLLAPRQPLLRSAHPADDGHGHPVEPLQVEPAQLKSAKRHLAFPTRQRLGGYAMKILWGVLLGAGTLVGIMALVPTAHFLIIGLLAAGAIAYTAKTVWDIRKKHQEEKHLTSEVNRLVDESMDEFQRNTDIDMLETLVDSLESHAAVKPDREMLYAHVCEMEESLNRLKPLAAVKKTMDPDNPHTPAARYETYLRTHDVEQRIRSCKARIDRLRDVPGSAHQEHHRHIARVTPVKAEKGWFHSPRVFFQKLGNRALDFLGGATAGVAIGVGIMSFVAGAAAAGALLSNPVGWAMLGIIAGAVAVGTLAVVINYTVSRAQQKKIDSLSATKAGLENTQTGLRKINTSMRQMLQIQQHAANAYQHEQRALNLEHDKNLLLAETQEVRNTTLRIMDELHHERERFTAVDREKNVLAEQHERALREAELHRRELQAAEDAKRELVLQHERVLRDAEERQRQLDLAERAKRELESRHEQAVREAEARQKLLEAAELAKRELEARHQQELKEAAERVAKLQAEAELATAKAREAELRAEQVLREKEAAESRKGTAPKDS